MRIAVLAGWLTLVFSISSAWAEPQPHPTRADRWVDLRDGVEVEYSLGLETYVEACFEVAVKAQALHAERQAEFAALSTNPPLPLSARDMVENHDRLLQRVVQELGMEGPTSLQSDALITFVNYYTVLESLMIAVGQLSWNMYNSQRFTVWRKEQIVERIKQGEKFEYFSYTADGDHLNFNFNYNSPQKAALPDPDKAIQNIESNRLDHSFAYRVDKGVASISAGFKIKVKKGAAAVPVNRRKIDPIPLESVEFPPWPIVIGPKNRDKTAEEVVGWEELKKGFEDAFERAKYRNAQIVHTILHEVIEVGLVERYIGSKDRRWFCDGLANYVAWKIMKDLAGEEFATSGYSLNAQLAQYTELQRKISLRKWPAVEYQDPKEKDSVRTRAHYAYATRVFALAAEQQGPTFIAEWLKQIGKTDRAKVNHRTIEKAYAKLTGGKLSDLLRAAESNKIVKPF